MQSERGVGESTSCVNLGIGLAQEGQKVLLVDCDPQGSVTISILLDCMPSLGMLTVNALAAANSAEGKSIFTHDSNGKVAQA